jgi:Nif-specific regulatory protein
MELIDNRYEIQRQIGQGAFGSVYLARDRREGQIVCLKILLGQNFAIRTEISREFALLTRLSHPSLLKVFDFGIDPQHGPYFTMEYAESGDLGKYRSMPPDKFALFFASISSALEYIHRQNIVHGDLKPQNILIDSHGNFRLADFGLAALGSGPSESFGTAAYVAPEVIQGRGLTPAADIYSLGLLSYELISGHSPFGDTADEILTRKLVETPMLGPMPDEFGGLKLTAILARMISADLGKRYKSMSDVIADFSALHTKSARRLLQGGGFVGRVTELEWLESQAALWESGRNTILLITGDSGVGKSALLDQFKVRAQLAGRLFYRAYCRENDQRPFSPILKLLEHLFAELDPGMVKFESFGPDLKRLYPALYPEIASQRLTEADIKSSRRRLFDNLLRYFGEICTQSAAFLAIEDLQWADSDTLEFLETVFPGESKAEGHAAFVICTAHSDPEGLIARLSAAFPARILKLEPADSSTWQLFIDGIFGPGHGLNQFANELFKESGGNFLFAIEIMKELAATNLIIHSPSGWQIEPDWRERLNVPQGVLPILSRRLDRLAPMPRSIAEIGAAIGTSFLPDDISVIGGSDLSRDSSFDELVTAGVLNWVMFGTDRRLDFTHGQLRRATYDSIPEPRRRDLHKRIADHLSRHGAGPEARGHHFLLAGKFKQALVCLIDSARNAEAVFAYRKAAQFYRSAVKCLDEQAAIDSIASEVYRVYLGLGRALDFISPAEAAAPFEKTYAVASRPDGPPLELAEAALALGNNLVHIGANEKAENYLLQAAEISERLGDNKLGGESAIGLGFAYDKMGRLGDAERSYLRALDLFSDSDYAEGSCRALNYLGIIRKRQGDFNGALDFYRRALDISLERGFLWLAMNLYGNLGNLHLSRNEHDKGLEYYIRSLEISREISDRRIESINLLNIGHVNNESGRLDEAERYFSEALAKFKEIGDKGSEAITLNNLGLLHFRKGEMGAAIESYRSGFELSLAISQPRPELANRIGLAEVYLAIADYPNARRETEKSIEIARQMNDMEQLTIALALTCELFFDSGSMDRAADCVREHLSLPENMGDPNWRRRALLIGDSLGVEGIPRNVLELSPGDRCEPLKIRLSARSELNRSKTPELWLARLDDAIKKAAAFHQNPEVWRLRALKIAFLERCGEKFEQAREVEKLRAAISIALSGLDNTLLENLLTALKIELSNEKGSVSMTHISREERLEVLIRVTRTINTIRELDPLLNKIMDLALETLDGERGFIMLFPDGATGGKALEPKVARNLAREDILSETTISHSSALDVAMTGRPLLLARTETGAEARQSVLDFRISSVLCAPLTVKGEVLGIVYVDSRSGKTFTNDDLEFLTNFGDLAAIAITNARLAEGLSKKNIYLQKQVESIWGFGNIVGRSAAMQRVFRMAESVSETDVTVVITGESGTGKEILARAIHFAGSRKKNNFVPVDCGALAETLLESELFGYVKGAFTGAASDREGLFEVAEGGTVFLDEINNTSKAFQAKLLRVLQESEIRRVGDNRIRKVDARVVAATNKDLLAEVKSGNFREDLYYRLNVVNIALPPLRERPEDIPILANYFLERVCGKMKLSPKTFAPPALDLLLLFDWPGNVRQLENACERAVIFTKGDTIDADDLPGEIRSLKGPAIRGDNSPAAPRTKSELKAEKLRLEKLFLTNLLDASGGNVMEASRLSGMDRSQIHHLMSRFGINSVDYKKSG